MRPQTSPAWSGQNRADRIIWLGLTMKQADYNLIMFGEARAACRLTFNARRCIFSSIMIQSFKCLITQSLFAGQSAPRFANIRHVAERKLQMLHRAVILDDLRIPPNNRLKALKGDRKGQHSIRINDQWRVCFVWHEGHAWDVEIVDYH